MTIHTLHDLAYAYGVPAPVREMLFALQDRIDALEAKRKPLTDEEIEKHWKKWVCAGRPNYSFARAIEAAHGIKEGI